MYVTNLKYIGNSLFLQSIICRYLPVVVPMTTKITVTATLLSFILISSNFFEIELSPPHLNKMGANGMSYGDFIT